ncbi:MAG TPA: hypothetical protein VF599_07960 [Pyrinomonadaceae bacterium]|jgi:hypothetical protein
MKLIFSLLWLLSVFGVNCAAQSACDAQLRNAAPMLLNLKLGMSPAQAQSVFGRDLKIKNKRKGEYTFFQNFIERKAPHSLANIRALYLRFFDGRLYQIEIFYEEKSQWQTLEAFTAMLSSQWNFPANLWITEKSKARVDCGEFTLVADNVLNPRIEITNESDRAQAEDRRKGKND